MTDEKLTSATNKGDLPAFLVQAGTPSAPTVIGAESNFIGDLSISEGQDLHIEGCVVGNVFHGGKVVIADSGIVIGSIFAAHLEVHGVIDAPDGEILAANLVVHGTSRINASEVSVAAGCMNYERGGFMSAQMGMLPASDVSARIEALLGKELSRAKERRASIEQIRDAARDLRSHARASERNETFATGVSAFVPPVSDQAVVASAAAPIPAPAAAATPEASAPAVAAPVVVPRVPFSLVPPIVDASADEEEVRADAPETRAYAG